MLARNSRNKLTLVNLIARLFWGFCLVIFAALFVYNFQFNKEIIGQEIRRNLEQTGQAIQQQFESSLELLRIQQDTASRSRHFTEILERKEYSKLDDHFQTLEELSKGNGPSLKFVYSYGELKWEDGNGYLYGLKQENFIELAEEIEFVNNWHFHKFNVEEKSHHLLLRRTPIVSAATGEVFGQYIIALVLDDNYMLTQALLERSQSSVIGIRVGNEIIAQANLTTGSTKKSDFRNYLLTQDPNYITYMPLLLQDSKSDIEVIYAQSSRSIEQLNSNFRFGLILAFVLVSVFTLIVARWVKKKMEVELRKVMRLTRMSPVDQVMFDEQSRFFKGSDIVELDRIGRILESKIHEIQSKEKSFRDLFNFSVSPTIVWANDNSIVQSNPAAIKAFNLNEPTSIVQLTKSLQSLISQAMKGAVLSGIDINIEKRVYRWSFSLIEFDSGLVGVIGQALDITTLIEAKEQSKQAQIVAEKAANARAEFIAKVSHEIRTPLNGILGITQLLKNEHNDTRLENVNILHQSGEHLLAVLNDILDFSKIDQGVVEIEKAPFYVSELIETIKGFYGATCKQNDLVLEVVLNGENTQILSDQVRIMQIVFNLMNNAIKFTDTGKIKCTIEFQEFSYEFGFLHIQVQDTGKGMSSDFLNDIFEPFTQENTDRSQKYGGTGLGLSIVKNLLDVFEGKIEVRSKEEDGSTFTLRIPVDKIANDSLTNHDIATILTDRTEKESQLRLLLVEDNKTNAYIIKALCKDVDVDIIWEVSGNSAIERLKEEKFDLILMDNQMPKMSGIETTRVIRDELKLNTPIYACTANGHKELSNEFIDVGANYILIKPVQEKLLRDALRFYMSEQMRVL